VARKWHLWADKWLDQDEPSARVRKAFGLPTRGHPSPYPAWLEDKLAQLLQNRILHIREKHAPKEAQQMVQKALSFASIQDTMQGLVEKENSNIEKHGHWKATGRQEYQWKTQDYPSPAPPFLVLV